MRSKFNHFTFQASARIICKNLKAVRKSVEDANKPNPNPSPDIKHKQCVYRHDSIYFFNSPEDIK
jgi:hypothetical protein